jgi:uncharacterized repeat protein (TIGR03803 family)
MRSVDFGRYALSSCFAAAMLAGCSGSQPPIAAPGGQAPASALAHAPLHRILPSLSSYQLLHRFPGYANDGFNPQAALIDVNGTFYGTTYSGGGAWECGKDGCGTVFSIDASGAEKVLHSFTGVSDGAYPQATLLDVSGTLYGTTTGGDGGTGNYGTVYSITPSGREKVLLSFGSGSGGSDPVAPLIDVNGVLYGTTVYGGTSNGGTVYSITTSGREKVLHSFAGGSDGALPTAPLINVKGTLYGTTSEGGRTGCGGGPCGTVYSITTDGAEKVLYSFGGGSDGEKPLSGLVNVSGTLYGTTIEGGGSGCVYGCGTAYSITTAGTEEVIHSFTGGLDGALPHAGLIDVNGTLYGTTVSGAQSSCVEHYPWFAYQGCGTIYSLTTSGGEKVLFDFKIKNGEPDAGLLNVSGVLYGTTPLTGRDRFNHRLTRGTAFAFTL